MLRDAGYGQGAWALHTRNDTAYQHGSSAERGEPARAPQGSAIVEGDQVYAADENKWKSRKPEVFVIFSAFSELT